MVKLQETKDRRRLYIGSIFVDLNETDYQELLNIFGKVANKNFIKPVVSGSAFKIGDRVWINNNYSNNFLCEGVINGITENRCGVDLDNGNKESSMLSMIQHCQ